MTDAGVQPSIPPSTADRVKVFIADLARPFAIYVIALASAYATIAPTVDSVKLAAALAALGALYTAKTIENNVAAAQSSKIEVAKVQSPNP